MDRAMYPEDLKVSMQRTESVTNGNRSLGEGMDARQPTLPLKQQVEKKTAPDSPYHPHRPDNNAGAVITIDVHKSQGSTLNNVEVADIHMFVPGQQYTAYTRASSPDSFRVLPGYTKHGEDVGTSNGNSSTQHPILELEEDFPSIPIPDGYDPCVILQLLKDDLGPFKNLLDLKLAATSIITSGGRKRSPVREREEAQDRTKRTDDTGPQISEGGKPDLMSDEETDEDHDNTWFVRRPAWRSDRLTMVINQLQPGVDKLIASQRSSKLSRDYLLQYSKTAKTQRSRVPAHAYFKKIECVVDRQVGTGCVPGRRVSIALPELRYFKPNLGELFRPERLCQQSSPAWTTRGKGISEASGLLKWLKGFQTMATHVLCDLLPHLTALSLCFQQREISNCMAPRLFEAVEQTCQWFLRPQIDDDDAPNNRTQHQSEQHSAVTVVTYIRPPSVPVAAGPTRENTDESTQENTDKPTQENTDESTQENIDDSTQENTDEPTQENTNESTRENTDKPTRENTDEPTRENTDESTQENTDKPTRENTDKPTRENTDKPTRENTDESTRQNTDESTQENTDESTRQNTDESTRQNTDEPTQENTDESTRENTDESTQENTDKPTRQNTDESTRQNTDKPTRQNTDEPTQQNTDESTQENTDKPTRQNTDESTRQNTDKPTRQNTDEPTQQNTDESTQENTDESK
ncbi:hypothetical protein Bbelb_425260 [Branchiostoma belcheri]|nr:hypothetical protein Bbelb_425260 [Branchiostoma belcheri]